MSIYNLLSLNTIVIKCETDHIKSSDRPTFQNHNKSTVYSRGRSRFIANKRNIARINRGTADHESRERLRAAYARHNKRRER